LSERSRTHTTPFQRGVRIEPHHEEGDGKASQSERCAPSSMIRLAKIRIHSSPAITDSMGNLASLAHPPRHIMPVLQLDVVTGSACAFCQVACPCNNIRPILYAYYPNHAYDSTLGDGPSPSFLLPPHALHRLALQSCLLLQVLCRLASAGPPQSYGHMLFFGLPNTLVRTPLGRDILEGETLEQGCAILQIPPER
jgi:hypothetical protein